MLGPIAALLRTLGSLFVAVAAMQAMRSSVRLLYPLRTALLATSIIVMFELAWVILFGRMTVAWASGRSRGSHLFELLGIGSGEAKTFVPAVLGVICAVTIGVITHIGFSRMALAQAGPGFPIDLTHRK